MTAANSAVDEPIRFEPPLRRSVFPRLHLFEFHDQLWFPSIFRGALTEYLRVVSSRFQLHVLMAPVIAEALSRAGTNEIVDLCSGGSGPVLPLREYLASSGHRLRITLTDKFPNAERFRSAEAATGGQVRGCFESVDATGVPSSLTGVRTLFNAFHHFGPALARGILADAFRRRRAIVIFEATDRGFLSTLTMFPVCFLAMLFFMPSMRPVRASWLFFTYVVPLIPLTMAWDGLASQLRSYTGTDFELLTEGLRDETYEWKAGRVSASGKPAVTFLMGLPVGASVSLAQRERSAEES